MKIAQSKDFDIRYSHADDLESLRRWLKTPGMLHWFPMGDDAEMENAAQVWISFSRFSASLTAIHQGVPCGIGTLFLMPYRKVAHHCIFKIIVDPDHWGQGIGSALLKNLKHLAKNYFRLEIMHIEFFEGNPIEHLLKKFDFHEFARQQRYVKEGDKYFARILMESNL